MLEARLPKGWKVYRDEDQQEDHDPSFGFKRVNSSGVVLEVDENGTQRVGRPENYNPIDHNKTATTTTEEYPLTAWRNGTTGHFQPTPPPATRLP